MASVNKAILVGNLGRDPEMRSTQDGRAIASLAVATSESWKDKATGDKKERTEWHRVSVFGQPAEYIGRYAKKGDMVWIEGQIQTRKWTDKEGQDRYTTEIIVQGYNSTVSILSSRGEASPQQSSGGGHDPFAKEREMTGTGRPSGQPYKDEWRDKEGPLNDEIPF